MKSNNLDSVVCYCEPCVVNSSPASKLLRLKIACLRDGIVVEKATFGGLVLFVVWNLKTNAICFHYLAYSNRIIYFGFP